MQPSTINYQLDDAPSIVLGYYFFTQAEFKTFARLGSLNRMQRLYTAWWRVELHLKARNSNPSLN